MTDFPVVLKKMALVNVDMQNCFVQGYPIQVLCEKLSHNICCETTAREANARDFRVFFMSDGTGTFGVGDLSAQEIQKATCTTLGFAFAQVITVNEMIDKIKSAMGKT